MAITKTKLKQLQKKYGSDSKIGEAVGCSAQEVFRLRKKLEINSIYEKNEERNGKILALKAKGNDDAKIANRFNLSPLYVGALIKRLEEKTKPKKKSKKILATNKAK